MKKFHERIRLPRQEKARLAWVERQRVKFEEIEKREEMGDYSS